MKLNSLNNQEESTNGIRSQNEMGIYHNSVATSETLETQSALLNSSLAEDEGDDSYGEEYEESFDGYEESFDEGHGESFEESYELKYGKSSYEESPEKQADVPLDELRLKQPEEPFGKKYEELHDELPVPRHDEELPVKPFIEPFGQPIEVLCGKPDEKLFEDFSLKPKEEHEEYILPDVKRSLLVKPNARFQKRFECTYCKKRFLRLKVLTLHLQVHTGEDLLAESTEDDFYQQNNCIDFQEEFKLNDSLEENEQIFYCTDCNMEFNNENDFNNHTLHHTTEEGYNNRNAYIQPEEFRCNDCSTSFKTHDNLMQHRRRIHRDKRPYACYCCDKRFALQYLFDDHMRSHINYFACTKCPVQCDSKEQLKVHLRSHINEKPFECMVCYERFARHDILMKHKASHRGKKSCICPFCNNEYADLRGLRIHMRTHDDEKPYICKYCRAQFISDSGLRIHLLKSHDDNSMIDTDRTKTSVSSLPYVCSICRADFLSSAGLRIHHARKHRKETEKNLDGRFHTAKSGFSCFHCKAIFATRVGWRLHLRKVHNKHKRSNVRDISGDDYEISADSFPPEMTDDVEKPYFCSDCPLRFAKNEHLKKHYRVHTGEKPYRCYRCLKAFGDKRDLKEHLLQHEKTKRFKCKYCSKKFNDEVCFKEHKLSHIGDNSFECPQCLRRYSSKYTLTQHMHIHSRVKCPECGNKFASKHNLKVHLRTHTGERPFACRLCDKRCFQMSHLKTHMLIHNVCCNIEFPDRKSLVAHATSHRGKRAFYSCSKCPATFLTRSELMVHVKTHSQEERNIYSK